MPSKSLTLEGHPPWKHRGCGAVQGHCSLGGQTGGKRSSPFVLPVAPDAWEDKGGATLATRLSPKGAVALDGSTASMLPRGMAFSCE